MADILESRREPGEIITFYSFKGGTGRTMTLANLAILTAKISDRVLVIDWDLEAPGLQQYFNKYIDLTKSEFNAHPGLINFFEDFRSGLTALPSKNDDSVRDFLNNCNFGQYIISTTLGVQFLNSGSFSDNYVEKINSFQWQDFFKIYPNVFTVFSAFLEDNFEYIFIDSRTGFTDASGICTTLMPEKLCLVFTPNRQSLDGVLELGAKALDHRMNSDDFRPLKIYPIPSRVELTDKNLRELWRKGSDEMDIPGYQPSFEKLFNEYYELNKSDLTGYFDAVQIHHEPSYAYGEELAVLNESFSDRLSLTPIYESLLRFLLFEEEIYKEHSENSTIIYISFGGYDGDQLILDNLKMNILKSEIKKPDITNNLFFRQKLNYYVRERLLNCNVFISIVTSSDYFKSFLAQKEIESLFSRESRLPEIILCIIFVGEGKTSVIPIELAKLRYLSYSYESLPQIDYTQVVGGIAQELKKKENILSPTDNGDSEISDIEKQFIIHAASELTYKEIAEKMAKSLSTIDAIRQTLFRKFNTKSRVGLILAAIRNGIVDANNISLNDINIGQNGSGQSNS